MRHIALGAGAHGLTRRSTRNATAGFARFRIRVNSNVRPRMSSAQPHLAPWDRRLLAAALDAALLIVIGVFLYGAIEDARLQREALVLALAVLYAAYQAASTLWPELSLGRTVAGVLVLSYQRGGAPT